MRQTRMDRWIEAAEARRISQIAQEMRPMAPLPPMTVSNSLMTKLRSMVTPQIPASAPGSRGVGAAHARLHGMSCSDAERGRRGFEAVTAAVPGLNTLLNRRILLR